MAKYEMDMDNAAVKQFVDEAESLGACAEGILWARDIEASGCSFRKFLQEMISNPNFNIKWMLWLLANMRSTVPQKVQDDWMRTVTGSVRIGYLQEFHPGEFTADEISIITGGV